MKLTIEEHVAVADRNLVNDNQVQVHMVAAILVLRQQTVLTSISHLRPGNSDVHQIASFCSTLIFAELRWCFVQQDQDARMWTC